MNTDTETAAEKVLAQLVEQYYDGCRIYHQAPQPDSPLRVFWRIRLAVLAEVGDALAEAAGLPGPDWQFMNEQTLEAS